MISLNTTSLHLFVLCGLLRFRTVLIVLGLFDIKADENKYVFSYLRTLGT